MTRSALVRGFGKLFVGVGQWLLEQFPDADDDDDAPLGHMPVSLNETAMRMRTQAVPEAPEPVPNGMLAGSLQARMHAARGGK